MTLEVQFKDELAKLLNQYEIKNSHLTIDEAEVITALRSAMINTIGLLKLQQDIIRLAQTLRGKFFSFLPFVSDLKQDILNFLSLPQFALSKLFLAESMMLREENVALKRQLQQLSEKKPDNLVPIAKDVALYEKVAVLENNLLQANQLLKIENSELTKSLNDLASQNKILEDVNYKLQATVDGSLLKIKQMQNELTEKELVVNKLRAENEHLKNLLNMSSTTLKNA